MPESNGEEMVCHLRQSNADLGDVFDKVNKIFFKVQIIIQYGDV
jgi:hypothetical protein